MFIRMLLAAILFVSFCVPSYAAELPAKRIEITFTNTFEAKIRLVNGRTAMVYVVQSKYDETIDEFSRREKFLLDFFKTWRKSIKQFEAPVFVELGNKSKGDQLAVDLVYEALSAFTKVSRLDDQ